MKTLAIIVATGAIAVAHGAFGDERCAKRLPEQSALQGIGLQQPTGEGKQPPALLLGGGSTFGADTKTLMARGGAGDVEAMDVLGERLLRVGGPMYFWGSWANDGASASWWRRAAALGDTKAMILLGHLYAEPWGARQDLREAAKWFKLAASNGRVEAARDLVRLYWGEWSDERDEAQAAIWLKRVDEMCGQRPVDWRQGLPFSYKDRATNLTVQVEADGRHVTATSPEGKIIWRRNPFVDAKMEPYRHARPIIRALEPAPDWAASHFPGKAVVGVSFSSSQFGLIDLATGDFSFMGQD